MNKLFLTSLILFLTSLSCNAEFIEDEFVKESLNPAEIQKPITNTNYNYESIERVPIQLKTVQKITSKNGAIQENQELKLYVKNNVKYKDKIIIRKNAYFTAKVETYMTKGMNGIPGLIILDNFKTHDLDPNKIKGTYIKKGFDLSLLVYPIKWALTPLPPLGSFTNFIYGCNASISHRNKITIYYYPSWHTK